MYDINSNKKIVTDFAQKVTDVASALLFCQKIDINKVKRERKYVRRLNMIILKRLSKYFLLFIFIFMIGNIMLAGMVMDKSYHEIANSIYSSLDSVATIKGATFYETHQSEEEYYVLYEETMNYLNECSKDEAVTFASISTMLEHVKIKEVYGRSIGNFNCTSCVEWKDEYSYQNNFDLIGTNTPELIDEITKHIQLSEGRYFTSEEIENKYVAIIPENLVDKAGNVLQVGDLITIEINRFEHHSVLDEIDESHFIVPKIQLEIVGKFKVIDEKHDINPYPYSDKIYVPNQVVENYSNLIIQSYEKALGIKDLMSVESEYDFPYFLPCTILPPYFELRSFKDMEEFKGRCERLLSIQPNIDKYYKVVTTNDTITRILEPLQSVERIPKILMTTAFVSMGLILFLFIGLFISRSSHEIALYCALGQKKSKIMMKYCGEIFIVVFISFLGIRITAQSGSEFISNKMIENIVIEENERDEYYYFESGQNLLDPNQLENEDITKNMKIKLTNKDYLLCGGYIFIISMIGCIFIIIKILRTNVKDLLL